MYIQDKVEEYADEIFSKLDNGAHIYFCGLKGTFVVDSFVSSSSHICRPLLSE